MDTQDGLGLQVYPIDALGLPSGDLELPEGHGAAHDHEKHDGGERQRQAGAQRQPLGIGEGRDEPSESPAHGIDLGPSVGRGPGGPGLEPVAFTILASASASARSAVSRPVRIEWTAVK